MGVPFITHVTCSLCEAHILDVQWPLTTVSFCGPSLDGRGAYLTSYRKVPAAPKLANALQGDGSVAVESHESSFKPGGCLRTTDSATDTDQTSLSCPLRLSQR